MAQVVVGRVGRAHGVRGEITVELRTDQPERRFAPGSVLAVETPDGAAHPVESVTVVGSRWHHGRLLVRFEGFRDRNAADALRGTVLLSDVEPGESPDDPEEFYDHQLVGLDVRTTDGDDVGRVEAVVHGPGQDLLVVATGDGEALVPFVSALVPEVDLRAGRVVVADRPGLLAPADHDEDA